MMREAADHNHDQNVALQIADFADVAAQKNDLAIPGPYLQHPHRAEPVMRLRRRRHCRFANLAVVEHHRSEIARQRTAV